MIDDMFVIFCKGTGIVVTSVQLTLDVCRHMGKQRVQYISARVKFWTMITKLFLNAFSIFATDRDK